MVYGNGVNQSCGNYQSDWEWVFFNLWPPEHNTSQQSHPVHLFLRTEKLAALDTTYKRHLQLPWKHLFERRENLYPKKNTYFQMLKHYNVLFAIFRAVFQPLHIFLLALIYGNPS